MRVRRVRGRLAVVIVAVGLGLLLLVFAIPRGDESDARGTAFQGTKKAVVP